MGMTARDPVAWMIPAGTTVTIRERIFAGELIGEFEHVLVQDWEFTERKSRAGVFEFKRNGWLVAVAKSKVRNLY